MAIYRARIAILSSSCKWLPFSLYSWSLSDALQPERESIGQASIQKCTIWTRLTSAVNRTHLAGLTSIEKCLHAKMAGLTRNYHQVAHHRRFFGRKDTQILYVLPISHAMARMPSCAWQSLLYNMVNHIRMCSTNTETNTQCCPCGNYKSERGFLICPLCNAVQTPNPAITYFQMFEQDEKFEMDLKDLESKYKTLMKKLHPDLSHGKSMEEKENFAQLSALVTTAYHELMKPVSRAAYMLKLRGRHVEDEGTVTDPDLIMEVMEIREALQRSPDRQTLERLHETAMTRMDKWCEAFKSALNEGDDAKAVGALQRMSYFGRVCEDINRELL